MAKAKKKTLESVPTQETAPEFKTRSPEAINADYASLCTQLGDRIIKLTVLNMEIEGFKKKVNDLSKELQLSAQERFPQA